MKPNTTILALVAALCMLAAAGCGILPKHQPPYLSDLRKMEALQKKVLDRVTAASTLPEKDAARIAACRQSADDLSQVMRMTEKMVRSLREEGILIAPTVLIDIHNDLAAAWSSLAADKIDEELFYQLSDNLTRTQWLIESITTKPGFSSTPFDPNHPAWKYLSPDKQETWDQLTSEERQTLKRQALKQYKEENQKP